MLEIPIGFAVYRQLNPNCETENTMMKTLSGIAMMASLIHSCLLAAQPTAMMPIPERIVAQRGGFIPEGIEYDNLYNRFLTGSIADGSIYAIGTDGSLHVVVDDPELEASVGIEVDEQRNRLLVANASIEAAEGGASLGVYQLNTGQRLAMIDLAGVIPDRPADASHFANDVAVSRFGEIYVTDTRMNIIYKVDNYYRASVFLDLGRDSGLNINGIEYHPNGYLLVVSPGTGQLLRIPVNDPESWSFVDLELPATGGDGLVWAADGSLAVVSNNLGRVTKYSSDDFWLSAGVSGLASFDGQGTTGATVGNYIYVVQPHFADPEPPVILRAEF